MWTSSERSEREFHILFWTSNPAHVVERISIDTHSCVLSFWDAPAWMNRNEASLLRAASEKPLTSAPRGGFLRSPGSVSWSGSTSAHGENDLCAGTSPPHSPLFHGGWWSPSMRVSWEGEGQTRGADGDMTSGGSNLRRTRTRTQRESQRAPRSHKLRSGPGTQTRTIVLKGPIPDVVRGVLTALLPLHERKETPRAGLGRGQRGDQRHDVPACCCRSCES
jgi:hypothetical protein